ncbi:TylF/MycF/NovP-related O-methyltransferase [Noviherbaspirillum sp.]|uniref:TylF/MycF/NovP-related O-methyltransferase n=1 Tax=Noviherbaspirillum sp. TaxID=1926288 RepID=UPI002FE4016E
MPDATTLYLDLLKQCLCGAINPPGRREPIVSHARCAAMIRNANDAFGRYLTPMGHTVEMLLSQRTSIFTSGMLHAGLHGMHRETTPDTMSDLASLDNLQACVESAIRDEVPGDLIETGIWKGGMPVLMRAILKAHGIADRTVWAADSFMGMPKPDPATNLLDAIWHFMLEPLDGLKIPRDYVEGIFSKYGLLDDQVRFLEGWFSDTLPIAPIRKLAVMRLDGDWYESTRTAIESLYPKLSPGGFIIVDDYGLPLGCRDAIDEYRHCNGIDAPIHWVNHQVIFWRKPLH